MRRRPARTSRRAEVLAEAGPVLARAAVPIALLAALVALASILSRPDTYTVSAVFDEVRGLIPGGAVKAGAQDVGRVEDVRVGANGLPVVTMRVDADFRLRRGAFADIRMASNVGVVNRFVDLRQGDGPELPDGARLGPSRTDQPVDLDSAVSELTPRVRAELRSIIGAIDDTLRDRGEDLDATLRHSATALGETADLAREVARDGEALRTLVGEGRRVVGVLAQERTSLGRTADRLAAVLQATGDRAPELRRTTRSLAPGLRSARRGVDRLAAATPHLRALMADTRPLAAELRPTARALRPALTALEPLLREANGLIGDAPAQMRVLRPVLRRAGPVLERLDPVLEGLGPLLDHLRVKAPEVTGFFALAADATSNYDAAGNLIRATFIPIQSVRHPNLVGPSDPGPGLLQRPFDRTPGALEGEPWEDYWTTFIGGGEPVDSYVSDEERAP